MGDWDYEKVFLSAATSHCPIVPLSYCLFFETMGLWDYEIFYTASQTPYF